MKVSADTLMRQAPMTVEVYLTAVVKMVDERFGAGYAKANPELVGTLVLAAGQDFETTMRNRALGDAEE